MPGPLDAEFATSLIRRGMDPAAVLDAARRAEETDASLLGWLARQRRLGPADVDAVLAATGRIPCPACADPLPLADLWPRLEFACPRCAAPLTGEGVAPRLGAVCRGLPDPGPAPRVAPTVADTRVAPTGGLPAGVGLAVGQTFRGFELLEELGRGGMGVVFRARQQTPRREVALKVLLTRGTPAEQRARFRREIDALADLGGEPGIVTIYEAGEDQGLLYFAMELLQGGSLSDLIRTGPVAPQRALQLGAETARALHVAHEAGIVHRDIKPANILLTRSGRPKVGDFGLVIGAGDERVTHSGDVVGTPRYLAPEQLDTGEVDLRADVYALGVVLYELLSGAPPFQNLGGLPQLYSAILTKTAPRLTEQRPEIADLIERTLAKAPADRPQTALALAEELERCRLSLSAPPAPRRSWAPVLVLVGVAGLAAGGLVLRAGLERPAPIPEPTTAGSSPLPAPAPTPSPPASAFSLEPQLEQALTDLRRAVDGHDKAHTGRVIQRNATLLERAQRDPVGREATITWVLAAWTGRAFNEPPYGLPAAERALRTARGRHRAWALEAKTLGAAMSVNTTRDPRERSRLYAAAATAASTLLDEYPAFAPVEEFFAAGTQSAAWTYGVDALKTFTTPGAPLPRPPRAATAQMVFRKLAARNRRNRFGWRAKALAAEAALLLGQGARDEAERVLARAVACDPEAPFARVVRAGYLVQSGRLASARSDIAVARRLLKDVQVGHRWHPLRTRLDVVATELGTRGLLNAWTQLHRLPETRSAQGAPPIQEGVRQLLRRRPELQKHPLVSIIVAWLYYHQRSRERYAAAERAVAKAGSGPYRTRALEVRVVTAYPNQFPKRVAQTVADVEALLKVRKLGFPLHGAFLRHANDAGGTVFGGVHGLATFGYGDRLRPPTLKQPERALAYFGTLTARAAHNPYLQVWCYGNLAAVLLARGDHKALTLALDQMVGTRPGYFLGRIHRASYRLHHLRDLAGAEEDLRAARRWFTANPGVYATLLGHVDRLERGVARARKAGR